MDAQRQHDELQKQWATIVAKLRQEFDDGPVDGVTLAPGEAAFLYRVLKESGIRC